MREAKLPNVYNGKRTAHYNIIRDLTNVANGLVACFLRKFHRVTSIHINKACLDRELR